jgi:hypothetical protein
MTRLPLLLLLRQFYAIAALAALAPLSACSSDENNGDGQSSLGAKDATIDVDPDTLACVKSADADCSCEAFGCRRKSALDSNCPEGQFSLLCAYNDSYPGPQTLHCVTAEHIEGQFCGGSTVYGLVCCGAL